MARFRPFRGIRFSDRKVDGLDRVVAPPYDVIGPDKRDELYRGSAHNVTRLILNPEGHGEAARQFRGWLDDGTLERDDSPSFYVYRQDFACDGAKTRVGVIGAMHLEPVILNDAPNEIPHQYLSAAKARRQLGWAPAYTLEQGMAETIAWYREYFAEQTKNAGLSAAKEHHR